MTEKTDIRTKINSLPSIHTQIKIADFKAQKSLGQHFLFDMSLTHKIARSAGNLSGTVIEIGPGPGSLTRALLAEGARKVIAIEKDPRAIRILQDLLSVAGESLELIEGDARGYPIWNLESRPRKIIANLPYNVATNLFLSWLEHSSAFESMTLMFQREVAERLVAKTGCSEYGRLSVLTQFLADSEILFDIPATAFVPPPKVTSSLVKIIPLPTPRYTCNQRTLELITSLAFGQRRKMLRGSLKSIGGEFLLQRANIDPKKRPQDLSVRDFCNLAKTYDS